MKAVLLATIFIVHTLAFLPVTYTHARSSSGRSCSPRICLGALPEPSGLKSYKAEEMNTAALIAQKKVLFLIYPLCVLHSLLYR
jgi:hypothetical protein